jgi:hypothetical protein
MLGRTSFVAGSLLIGAGLVFASAPVRATPLLVGPITDAIAAYVGVGVTVPFAESGNTEADETAGGLGQTPVLMSSL